MHQPCVVAVIIPAYNEQVHIGATIAAARRHLEGIAAEFIVADNGSTDDTAAVARANGARVLVDPHRRVGGLRNLAVAASDAEVLLFLDADVHLTAAWRTRFTEVLAELRRDPQLVTGSTYGVPADPSWIERNWFLPLSRRSKSYINSGHLIVSRSFFQEIGGFDDVLETGEDFEFCHRARRRGGRVVLDEKLPVEHLGFPRTIRAFVSREAWHGLGDFQTVGAIAGSRVALAALLFGTLHIAAVLAAGLGLGRIFAASFMGILAICMVTAARVLVPQRIGEWLVGPAVAYFYLTGRFLAALRTVARGAERRHERTV